MLSKRWSKELRELWPAFAATLLLIHVPYLCWGRDALDFGYIALGLGSVIMAGSAFGIEFQRRTMPLLLSQPVSRATLWTEKLGVLGLCLAVSSLTLGLRFYLLDRWNQGAAGLYLVPLCAFCGAPYLTLLVRHGIAGSVFAIAVPGLLIAGASYVTDHTNLTEYQVEDLITYMLWSYCALFYLLGYQKFKALEVTDGPATELHLPVRIARLWPRRERSDTFSARGQFLNLLAKELRLQQTSLLIAALFVLVAIAGGLLHWSRPESTQVADWVVAADFMIFVFLLPLLVGGLALAEERGWGISDWHLTLPPSSRRQWAAKSSVALTMSFLLGVVLPAAMMLVGHEILSSGGPKEDFPPPYAAFLIVVVQLLVTSLAVYAGSFSTSTLKAMLLALAMALGGLLVIKVAFYYAQAFNLVGGSTYGLVPVADWKAWCLVGVELLVVLGLTQWFAYRNFRQSTIRTPEVAIEMLTIFLVVGLFAVRFAVSYRV